MKILVAVALAISAGVAAAAGINKCTVDGKTVYSDEPCAQGATTLVPSQPPSPSVAKTSEPQQSKSTGPQGQTTTDQRGTEQSPAIVEILPTPKTQAEAPQDRKDREEKSSLDRGLVEFTGYLVVATAFLALIGILQLCVFGLQARRLRQTVEAMESTAERQLRAYLTIRADAAKIEGPDISIAMQIDNRGQTPAHLVSLRSGLIAIEHPIKPDFEFVVTATRPGFDISGGQVQTAVIATDILSADDIAAVHSGAKGLYLFGELRYDDAFKKHRSTRFRLLWDHRAGRPSFGQWTNCDEGNDAD